ncbi:MAG: BON domain-containing protein [Aureliella sp.]
MNPGSFANGGNYVYGYSGNVINGAYFGNANLGPVNAVGPVAPGLGLGAGNLGVGGVGASGLNGLVANEMALGGGLYSSLYGGVPAAGLGVGVPGAGVAGLGYGVPGINYGVPGYGVPGYGVPGYGVPGYGVPGVNYAVPGPVVPGATAGTTAAAAAANTAAARTPRTETFTNNAPQAGAAASAAGAPVVTVHAQQIQEHLARSNLGADFRNVKVLMSGRAVVLRGSVASQAEEQLVLRLVSLEPGVDGAISQLSYPGKIISGR